MKKEIVRPKKDHITILSEYFRDLNDDDLIWVGTRLNERVGSDLAEVMNFMSKKTSADYVLSSAVGSVSLYDTLDLAQKAINKEADKRKLSLKA